ncbi:MAG: hypothetical protein AAGD07_16415 [Planctomycetota bacterium]
MTLDGNKPGDVFDPMIMVNPVFWGRRENDTLRVVGVNNTFRLVFGFEDEQTIDLDRFLSERVFDLNDSATARLYGEFHKIMSIASNHLAELAEQLDDKSQRVFSTQEAIGKIQQYERNYLLSTNEGSKVVPYVRVDEDGVVLGADLRLVTELMQTTRASGEGDDDDFFRRVSYVMAYKYVLGDPHRGTLSFQGLLPRGEQNLLTKVEAIQEQLGVSVSIRSAAFELCDLLRETKPVVQQLESLLSPTGGLIFGGFAAEECFPPSDEKDGKDRRIEVNDRVGTVRVKHQWTKDDIADSSGVDALKDYVATVVLKVLGDSNGAKRPLWDEMRMVLNSPLPNAQLHAKALSTYVPNLVNADPSADEILDAYGHVRAWYHGSLKNGSFLRGSMLCAAVSMWTDGSQEGKLHQRFQEKHDYQIWVASTRPIDTIEALDSLRQEYGDFSSVESDFEEGEDAEGKRYEQFELRLIVKQDHKFDNANLKRLAETTIDARERQLRGAAYHRRGSMEYVLTLFGDKKAQLSSGVDLSLRWQIEGRPSYLQMQFEGKNKISLTWRRYTSLG